ncbi:hypothetical protein PR048_030128 [Dryococelus australis]|uniref:Uncharacterized protein n=1 Tax=Dryococelus australis TaxID=614101 RepID=A0ABQ9G833_9NEOP|nr:hypothetical protein PR048_030128 [Dryococelus australis]
MERQSTRVIVARTAVPRTRKSLGNNTTTSPPWTRIEIRSLGAEVQSAPSSELILRCAVRSPPASIWEPHAQRNPWSSRGTTLPALSPHDSDVYWSCVASHCAHCHTDLLQSVAKYYTECFRSDGQKSRDEAILTMHLNTPVKSSPQRLANELEQSGIVFHLLESLHDPSAAILQVWQRLLYCKRGMSVVAVNTVLPHYIIQALRVRWPPNQHTNTNASQTVHVTLKRHWKTWGNRKRVSTYVISFHVQQRSAMADNCEAARRFGSKALQRFATGWQHQRRQALQTARHLCVRNFKVVEIDACSKMQLREEYLTLDVQEYTLLYDLRQKATDEGATCIQVILKQGFQKCYSYREQPMHTVTVCHGIPLFKYSVAVVATIWRRAALIALRHNHRARPPAKTPSSSQRSGTWTPKRRTDIGQCKAGPDVFPHPTSSQGRSQDGYVRPPSRDQLETASGIKNMVGTIINRAFKSAHFTMNSLYLNLIFYSERVEHRDCGGIVVSLLSSHQGDPGSIPGGVAPGILACGNRAGRCRWSAGFPGGLPLPQPLHSGAAPYSPLYTLIGSQVLHVKSHPNLSSPLHLDLEVLKRDRQTDRDRPIIVLFVHDVLLGVCRSSARVVCDEHGSLPRPHLNIVTFLKSACPNSRSCMHFRRRLIVRVTKRERRNNGAGAWFRVGRCCDACTARVWWLASRRTSWNTTGWSAQDLLEHYRLERAGPPRILPAGARRTSWNTTGWSAQDLLEHYRLERAGPPGTLPAGARRTSWNTTGWSALQRRTTFVARQDISRKMGWQRLSNTLASTFTRPNTTGVLPSVACFEHHVYATIEDFLEDSMQVCIAARMEGSREDLTDFWSFSWTFVSEFLVTMAMISTRCNITTCYKTNRSIYADVERSGRISVVYVLQYSREPFRSRIAVGKYKLFNLLALLRALKLPVLERPALGFDSTMNVLDEGPAVVERLACSPPAKANRVQSPAGSHAGIVRDDAAGQ